VFINVPVRGHFALNTPGGSAHLLKETQKL
jgi:hypothetical protein